jgi:hypothetical protein
MQRHTLATPRSVSAVVAARMWAPHFGHMVAFCAERLLSFIGWFLYPKSMLVSCRLPH